MYMKEMTASSIVAASCTSYTRRYETSLEILVRKETFNTIML